jgi:hypothetical protein
MKDIPVTGRTFLLQEGHSCYRMDIPVIRRQILIQDGNSKRPFYWKIGIKECQKLTISHRKY